MDERPFERKVYQARATTRRLRAGPLIRSSDAELVVKSCEGDPGAYNELVERYQNAARNRALSVVNDFQTAEDLAQDGFLKAFEKLGDLQEPHKFGPWLLTIVQHTALDFVRGKKDSMSLETMKEAGYEAPRDTRGLQIEKMQDREEELRILEALRDLREDYREIIILKHLEELSYKEIADRLNMTVSAVGEKLSRVRGMLKERLSRERIDVPERDSKHPSDRLQNRQDEEA